MRKLRKGQKLYVLQEVTMSLCVMQGLAKTSVPAVWLDGQVGVCPVFTNKRKALRAARKSTTGRKVDITEVVVD